jgi:uncharacterized protein (DUF1778 family)
LRRKRQVEGVRHDTSVIVYLSPEEKKVIKAAAKLAGMSLSNYCMSVALKKALADLEDD